MCFKIYLYNYLVKLKFQKRRLLFSTTDPLIYAWFYWFLFIPNPFTHVLSGLPPPVGAVEMKVKRLNWEKIDVVHENSVWAQVGHCGYLAASLWPDGGNSVSFNTKAYNKTRNRLLQITAVKITFSILLKLVDI